jgi:hypothetical protein
VIRVSPPASTCCADIRIDSTGKKQDLTRTTPDALAIGATPWNCLSTWVIGAIRAIVGLRTPSEALPMPQSSA